MNHRENLMLIFDAEFRGRVKQIAGVGDEGLKARLRFAMESALTYWLSADVQDRLHMAIAVVVLAYVDEGKVDAAAEETAEHIRQEVRVLQQLSAMIELGKFIEIDRLDHPIGIVPLWDEVRKEKGQL